MTLRVLLSNDDGIHADGLHTMRAACQDAGLETLTIAPDSNRSATGRAVTVRPPLRIVNVDDDPRHAQWACSGTPTDCVRVGLLSGAFPTVDIVISGINHGANLGDDINYSGTVSVAAEAALLGLPAIAASQPGPSEGAGFLAERPAEFVQAHIIAVMARALAGIARPKGLFLNVNLPTESTVNPPVNAPLGTRAWASVAQTVTRLPDGFEIQSWASDPPPLLTGNSDFDVVLRGDIAVTAMSSFGGVHDASAEFDLDQFLADLPVAELRG